MKRNKLFILGICTVMVALVSLSLVSGTWAKYTSTVSGEDSARVAKWDITYTDKDTSIKGEVANRVIEFDLFNTVLDTDGGATETDIFASDGSLIAPGTKGSFQFTVANNSEVNATYAVEFDVELNGVPVVFTIQKNSDTAANGLNNIPATAFAMGETVTYTITWEWDFDGDDTQLGLDTPSVNVSATFTFVQVD